MSPTGDICPNIWLINNFGSNNAQEANNENPG